MDKFPLLWEGKAIGELSAEQEALYTWFIVRCRLPGEGIRCAWAGFLSTSDDAATISDK